MSELGDGRMNQRAQAILRLDGGAALLVGVATCALRDRIAELHAFPSSLVLFVGIANLVYASYSGTLALRAALGRTPSRRAIDLLVAANLGWAVVCVVILVVRWRTASAFGLAHVGVEGVFVGALALAERRWVRPFAR